MLLNAGHFTTWLIAPSLIGVFVFISVVIQGTADSNLVPYYGLFMALWSTYVPDRDAVCVSVCSGD